MFGLLASFSIRQMAVIRKMSEASIVHRKYDNKVGLQEAFGETSISDEYFDL